MHKSVLDIVNDDEPDHNESESCVALQQSELFEKYNRKYISLKEQFNKSIVSKAINKITSLKCNICVTMTIIVFSAFPAVYFYNKPDDKKNFFCQLSLLGSSILQIIYTNFATILRTKGSNIDVRHHVDAFNYVYDEMYGTTLKNNIDLVKIYIKDQSDKHKKITIVAYTASLVRMLFLSVPFFVAKNVDEKYRIVILGTFILSNHILIQSTTACDVYAASRALQKNDNIKAAIKKIDICSSKNNCPNKKKPICNKKLITIFGINIATSLSCTIYAVVTTTSYLNNLNMVTTYNGSLISNNESFVDEAFLHNNTSSGCMKVEEDASFLRAIFCSQQLFSTIFMFAFQGFIRVATVTALSSKNKRACKIVVINAVRYSINTVLLTINAIIGNKNLVPEAIGAVLSATVTMSNAVENVLFKHPSHKKKDDKMVASIENHECTDENEQSGKFIIDSSNVIDEEKSTIKKGNVFTRFIECFTNIGSITTIDEKCKTQISDNDYCSDLATKIDASSTTAEKRLMKNTNSALTII